MASLPKHPRLKRLQERVDGARYGSNLVMVLLMEFQVRDADGQRGQYTSEYMRIYSPFSLGVRVRDPQNPSGARGPRLWRMGRYKRGVHLEPMR